MSELNALPAAEIRADPATLMEILTLVLKALDLFLMNPQLP